MVSVLFGGCVILYQCIHCTDRLPLPAASAGALYATQGAELSFAGQPLLAPVGLPQFAQRMADALKSYEREVRELHLQLFPEVLSCIRPTRVVECFVLCCLFSAVPLTNCSHCSSGPRAVTARRVSAAGRPYRCGPPQRRFACLSRQPPEVGVAALHTGFHCEGHVADQSPRPPPPLTCVSVAFSTELKEVLRVAGAENQPIVLLMEEHMLSNTAFLELINSLLSAGEVPGLFAQDELDQMLGGLSEAMADQGFFGSLFDFFVLRVRRNLRIVLELVRSVNFTCPKQRF
jgi:hypothetical protein